MGTYPTLESKDSMIDLLNKSNVSESVIKKFEAFPDNISHNNINFKLNNIITRSNGGDIPDKFELNYYSKEKIEFLFPYKVFDNVELSIDYLNKQLESVTE